MKYQSTAFYGDTAQLSWGDLFRLLIGRTVKAKGGSGPEIGLWTFPDTCCPCPNCREVFGPLSKKGREYQDYLRGLSRPSSMKDEGRTS